VCQEDLSQVLRHLPKFEDPNLIFGYDTVGDAGVYRLREDLAIIQTVDILTPIADDPFTFGEIAAANSLSDVYVMGGKPVTALNIIGFPPKLDLSIMEKIIVGSTKKVKEAGAVVVGGHTIKDDQLKFGLAVTAVIDPKNLITNEHATVGDQLILTKPLGTGVISTALKGDIASEEAVRDANDSMRELNAAAAEAMTIVGVNACTDITGFGLLGHASQLADASGVSLRIYSGEVPVFEAAREYAHQSLYPGGTTLNYKYVRPSVEFGAQIDEDTQMLLCDAQTSGGLLISVPRKKCPMLIDKLNEKNVSTAKVIGEVIQKQKKTIYIE
jgi:selenide,water dikinase